jgi:UDP-N-acetylglucosamine 2-epimerase (non-hydrolysing)/UDP-GlcNAc3NAcA epimerase
MRVLTVVGNRPQFVKAAAVSHRLRERHEEVLLHTGQHYDPELSQVFFEELGLPEPEIRLDLGGGSNTHQSAEMLRALEPILADVAPDVVLVYGDTNSTLAGGLAAAQAGVAVAHVEAGMRSYDRRMPEELNRVLTDHLSALLLVSSDAARENLEREAVVGTIEVVGDVMVDVSLLVQPRVRERTDLLERLGLEPGRFVLVTAHRAGNVDDPERLARLVELLGRIPGEVVFPVHPRTRARLDAAGLSLNGVRAVEPLGYLEFTSLLTQARATVTDSGGVQKEAYLAGVPCVTIRPNTEWVETVEAGWNALVDLDVDRALAALGHTPPAERPPLYGDGQAGARVVEALERWARTAATTSSA